MSDPLNDRPVSYYLDWLKEFRDDIEAAAQDKEVKVREIGAPLRGHPQADWLIKNATWAGCGVLRFKAQNPDWLLQYQESRSRFLYPPGESLH
jgi:hypothetical protein